MSVSEGRALLGHPNSSWTKLVIGSIAGACLATFVFSVSNTELFTAPSTPATAATRTTLVSQPRFINSPPSRTATTVAAEHVESQLETASTEQSASWTPLATLAGIPMIVMGALFALRTPKRAPLDPIDLLTTRSSKWAMMATVGEQVVARNYASALVELGQEGECLEQLHSDMDYFGSLLEDEDFGDFFSNPLLLGEKQKEIIVGLCDEANMSQTTKDFLCFLVDSKRIFQLGLIVKEFDKQFYEATGTQVATVTAAVPLSEEELRLIANKLHELTNGKNIKIKSQVDESLLAGFILEYGKSGSQRIDLSLRAQLAELQEGMEQGVEAMINAEVPAAVQLAATALGINAILAASAHADSGNIFDFGLTMPIQMIQFLLLMIFLEKTVFTPVSALLNERAEYLRWKSNQNSDNTKRIEELNAKAEELLSAARRDVSKELEETKKKAYALNAEELAKANAESEAELVASLNELQKAKDELWAKLETEVLPVLVEDIVEKLLGDEEEEEEESPELAPAATTATTE